MELGFICILLLSHYANAVVNKLPEQEQKEEDLQAAEDRISLYGAPPSNNVNNPGPVYGPPEITGDFRPPQVFPPPPPEQPPAVSPAFTLPFQRKPSVPFASPKPSYGAPPLGPPKPSYGPPKSRYGPPKRPSFGFSSFRPPKPKYGPPFNSGPNFNNPGHGPPIPLSVEAYGPPVAKPASSFNVPHKEYGVPSAPSNQYGPPPSNQYGPPPSNQYGPPLPSNQYGPPLPPPNRPVVPHSQYGPPQQQFLPPLPSIPAPPPPGIPAPPTPPDIKYDGWQPIAGSVNAPKNPELSNSYGPPDFQQPPLPSNNYGPPEINQGPPAQYGPPAETYGPPAGNQGPPSTSYGPPSQNYGPPAQNYGPPADTYGPPTSNAEHSSINPQLVTLITSNTGKSNIPSDSYGVPLHSPEAHNLKSQTHQASISPDSEDGLPPPPLPQLEPIHAGKGPGDTDISPHNTYGPPSDTSFPQKPDLLSAPEALAGHGGNTGSVDNQADLSLQQLPNLPPAHFNHPPQPLALSPPPRPFNSYGPPSQNYGPPISQTNGNRGHFGAFFQGNLFGKMSSFFGKNPSNFRLPPPTQSHGPATLVEHFTPPRPRPAMKFKEQVPSSVFSSLNRYLPPAPPANIGKPHKNYGPPSEPQLPNISPPVNFHNVVKTGTSTSYHTHQNVANSVLAAPNVNYGTPLSFSEFNTPTPLLTYGSPNFGPVPDTLKVPGNLYNNINSGIQNTYGTPALGDNNPVGLGNNCNFYGDSGQFNLAGNLGGNLGGHLGLSHQNLVNLPQNSYQAPENSIDFSYKAPSVHDLELQDNEQQKINLKDSYGNPIGISFEDSDQAGANLHASTSSSVQPVEAAASFVNSQSQALSQGYGEEKNFGSGIESVQFLNAPEGHQARALAQTGGNSDGFQIQGSNGIYTLQIQPADGGLGTEYSDGNIRHDQVLSNGLLQDIIAAIEQPQNEGHIQLQGLSENQAIEQAYGLDLHHAASSAIVNKEHVNYKSQVKKDVERHTADAGKKKSVAPLDKDNIALFFNNDYSDSNDSSANKTAVKKSYD